MNHLVGTLSVLSLSLVALGCAGSSSDPVADPVRTASGTSAEAPTDAIAIVRAGGTFAFALDESDPAATIRAGCEKSEPNDAAGCYKRVRTHAADEKIKLASDGAGHVVFTSFGPEDGRETVWIEIALDVAADGTRAVVATPAGPLKGAWAGKMRLDGKTLRFEVIDATTIVSIDPKKGRLVYHRVAS